jgi:hypothetical protein
MYKFSFSSLQNKAASLIPVLMLVYYPGHKKKNKGKNPERIAPEKGLCNRPRQQTSSYDCLLSVSEIEKRNSYNS